jgi:hypothetical protein
MTSCPHCGAQLAQASPYCPHCGGALELTTADVPPPDAALTMPISAARVQQASMPAPAPPPAPSLPPPAPDGPRGLAPAGFDWVRLVRGNWLGAGLVAGLTVGTAGLLAVVMTALAKPTDFGLDNSLTLVASILNGSFGADLVAQFRSSGESIHGSVGAIPLTVTVLALLVGVITFRRVTAGYDNVVDAVLDAVRASLVLAVALMVIALAFRADSREFGRGWGTQLAHLFDTRIRYGPSIHASFLLGFVTLLVPLLGSVWVRRSLWPDRLAGAARILVAPVYGLATLLVLLPVAGLVGLALMLATGDTLQNADPTSHDFLASASLFFGLLASGGFWLLSLGAGGSFGEHGSTTGEPSTSSYDHLGHFAGQDPGLWAAPVVMVAVFAAATWVVVRRAPSRESIQSNLLVWTLLVLVTTPLLVRLTSIHAAISARGERASGSIGVHGWQTTLLLTLVTCLCSVVAAWRCGVLDLSRLREAGRRLQTNPGQRPGPPGTGA